MYKRQVYAHNDRIAPGAYQAAKKAGREKEMIFVGIDALPGKGNGLELDVYKRQLQYRAW